MTGQTEQHDGTTVELVVAVRRTPDCSPAPPATGIVAQAWRCGRWFRRELWSAR